MKKLYPVLATALLTFSIFLTACTMNGNQPKILQGELMNTKGGPSVQGVYLPENTYDEYIGKNVKVSGKVVTVQGGNLVNEKGEYSAGFEGARSVMTDVESFEVIE